MANMSYIRFENTSNDFIDCLVAIEECEELSEREAYYAKRLYEQAKLYVKAYEEYVSDAEM